MSQYAKDKRSKDYQASKSLKELEKMAATVKEVLNTDAMGTYDSFTADNKPIMPGKK